MIKLQSILESLLSEVGENTATPYDFKVKREWEDEETWYEWKTDDEGEDPVKYTMTITKWSDYTGRGDDREFNYEVEFGIDVEGGGTDYYATSKTRRTGNMRRVMATVIAALKQEIAKDNKKPGVRVSSVYMSPSKEEETDQRRAKLYLSYIEKNKPAGSTVSYDADRGSIEIKLPKYYIKESTELNEAFDKPYPTKTLLSGENIETLRFMTSDRYMYEIRFYKLLGHIQKDSAWIVDFKNKDYNSFDVTDTGDQMRVFATVINTISDFIERREPEAVQFSASKRDSLSRKKLYTTLVNRYIPDEYELEVSEDPTEVNFSLKRKNGNPLTFEAINRKETEKINEAFDKPYPTETVTSSKSKESHSFTTSEEHEYAIEFDMEESTGGEETWSSEFYLKNPPSKRQYGQYAITGTGDQMRVFATVLSTMKDFLDRRRPKILEFIANKTSGTSRDRLYSTLVNRYTPTGYRVETQDFQSFNAYRIVRT